MCANPELEKWQGKVETNAHGTLLLSPPPSGNRSFHQRNISRALEERLKGYALRECPVSTIDGVRAADVGWYSVERFAQLKGQVAFEIAPEICVEILYPSNTPFEMRQKRKLYFEAGALEVWHCESDGTLRFFTSATDAEPAPSSTLCPSFPQII